MWSIEWNSDEKFPVEVDVSHLQMFDTETDIVHQDIKLQNFLKNLTKHSNQPPNE